MRNFLLLCLLLCLPAVAQDQTADRARLKSLLAQMKALEVKAAPVQWMVAPIEKRTAAQQREIEKRYATVEALNKQVDPILKTVNALKPAPGMFDKLEAVRHAGEALGEWLGVKQTYLNAGANNPSLKAMEKQEKDTHDAFLRAWQAAGQGL